MLSDLVQTLLHKREVTEANAIEKFLKPDFVRDVIRVAKYLAALDDDGNPLYAHLWP